MSWLPPPSSACSSEVIAVDYIPDWIYRWLPTLYIVAGSLFAAYGPENIGKPSALLLIWVGVAVFNMRLNARDGRHD